MQKWEYCLHKFDYLNVQEQQEYANKLGEHGWEMFAAQGLLFYFKRPKTE